MSAQEKIRKFLKDFWFLVWKDNSIKGWIVSIIFMFVVIKFIFFPMLSFITGTSLPLAIVESCSMHHDGNLFSEEEKWFMNQQEKYEKFGISQNNFSEFSFTRGFTKGDILFIVGADPEALRVGDVIIFVANQKNPVIHRIMKITEKEGVRTFETMGDNNNGQLTFEKNIQDSQIVGKAVFRLVPYAGWIKLIAFEPARTDAEKGFCA